jgi:hypothetical protein
MDVRRVVTGHDEQGKAVFVSDAVVSGMRPRGSAMEFHRLWGGDETPRFPDDGALPHHYTYFPPVGGFRFGIFSIPPNTESRRSQSAEAGPVDMVAEFEKVVPGLVGYLEPDFPGMHTTPTIDFEVVLSGNPVLELDDGATARLDPGDTVVQNGTRHRWSNPGTVPAVLAVFICGAHHERVPAS